MQKKAALRVDAAWNKKKTPVSRGLLLGGRNRQSSFRQLPSLKDSTLPSALVTLMPVASEFESIVPV